MDHIPNKTIRDDRFSERLFELFISVDKNIFFAEVEIICNLVHHSACEFSRRWGYSSAGRALRSQCRGRGFDPHYLHQATKQTEQVTVRQNKSNPNKFKGSNNHKDQYLFKQTWQSETLKAKFDSITVGQNVGQIFISAVKNGSCHCKKSIYSAERKTSDFVKFVFIG